MFIIPDRAVPKQKIRINVIYAAASVLSWEDIRMDWILSALSMAMLWMMGNKNRFAPLVGIFAQLLWIYYVISTAQYGLIVGVIGYLVIHIRNAAKWNSAKDN
jgi:hypothetical protein